MGKVKKPVRIQRKRTKGWRMPPNTVYVGRPTKWGNPYNFRKYKFYSMDQNRNAAIRDFEFWLSWELKKAAPKELRGKNLACYCPLDTYCHADVLLEIANKTG